MSNRFGNLFSLTTFGESHGPSVGGVVDGCPSLVRLVEAGIQAQLDRRRPGQSSLSSPRKEQDSIKLLSGLVDGVTLGTPIGFMVDNTDQRPSDYSQTAAAPRPSHADFTYKMKYGILAPSGGGRASARETIARVAGGAIAEAFLRQRYGVEVVAWVSRVGAEAAADLAGTGIGRADVDRHAVRCPDEAVARRMEAAIESVRADGDSLGGIVTCECRGLPVGGGEPVFDKLHALLGHAMLSIPAAKGVEFGSGFAGTLVRGSEHNDLFVLRDGHLRTATNRSGGVQGGISNGEDVVLRVAFKPTASIRKPQQSVDYEGQPAEVRVGGRHDPCVLPRAVPVVEAMAALVLADAALLAEANGRHRHV
jgi:chorismate synthase